jgi:polysaccharide biosynthesis/export protein
MSLDLLDKCGRGRRTASLSIRPGVVLLAWLLPLLIGACGAAPGMRFDPKAPVDPGDPLSVPQVATITPALIRDQNDERRRNRDDGYKALLDVVRPYRIGPADVLSIIVWEHPELVVPNLTYSIGETAGTLPSGPGLSTQTVPGFVVGAEGNIQYPYLGVVKAEGLTVGELQAAMTQGLARYLKNPQLTVSVIAYRSQRIFVEGQVAQPGIKPITDVPMSLAEALSEANGVPAGIGDTSRVQVLRAGMRYRLDLPALAAQGVDISQIMLRNRDVVRVLPQTYNQVFVVGEVGKPTPVPMHDGSLTLSEALAGAMSVDPATAEPEGIYVVRAGGDPGRPQVFRLDSKSPVGLALAEHFDLQPKDVVYVDATGLVRWSRVINLLLPSALGLNAARSVVGN